jgi:hypothetical protein
LISIKKNVLAYYPPSLVVLSSISSPLPVQLTVECAAAGAVASGAVPEWSRIAVRRAAMNVRF